MVRRSSLRLAAVGMATAVAVASCTSSVDEPTTPTTGASVASTPGATTTTTAPATPTTTLPPAGLVEMTDAVTGMTGLIPDGWAEESYGTYLQNGGTDAGMFVVQFFPGLRRSQVLAELGDLTAGAPVEEAGTIVTEAFTFHMYQFETTGAAPGDTSVSGRFGVARTDDGAYLIGLVAGSDESPRLAERLLAPAIEALRPWGSAEAALGIPPADAPYRDPTLDPEIRAADLVGRMTLREKVGQMTQIENHSLRPGNAAVYALGSVLSGGGGSATPNTPEAWIEMVDGFQSEALSGRLGVPVIYGVDSVHGHANLAGATVFPHNIGLGAAGDPVLVERIARATAVETTATGIRWNFGPVLAVSTDVRWGRTYESFGEDPALVARLGAAYVEGLQRDDLTDPTSVLATPKHFIGDGATLWGSSTRGEGFAIDQGVAPADDEYLWDVLVPPYQATFDAGARTVMASFSSWGDEKVHGEAALLTGLLRTELGFDGFLVSDWGAIDQIDPHYGEAVRRAVDAGVDLAMVPYDPVAFMWEVAHAVETGELAIERIDEAVFRILRVKFAIGLFEAPYSDATLLSIIGSEEHRSLAREAVSASLVLLKNDGALPLETVPRVIFVAGNAADDTGIQAGGWTLTTQGRPGPVPAATSILDAIRARAAEGSEVIFNRHGRLTGGFAHTEPDVCIAAFGEQPYAEGWGDSATLDLPGTAITERLREICPVLVVVIVSGRPVIITDHIDSWDAVVAAWLPGSEGAGVVDGLFGDRPFAGTLPVTWPASLDQLPAGSSEEPPLFPVGFGLETDPDGT